MAQVSGTGRGKNLRSTSTRKAAYAVGLLVAILGGLFVALASSASADTEANVPPIGKTNPADFATYPQDGLIPGGCGQDGAGVLTNIRYTITHNGVDRSATDLSVEQLFTLDTVKMSWDGYAFGCGSIGVSLAVKKTDHNVFVITDNQTLINYKYCSAPNCVNNSLAIQVPPKFDACNFQFDAVIGPPLQTVGPNGSYYSPNLRQQTGKAHPTDRNMLIGYSNGGKGTCIPPTATGAQSCTTVGGPSVDVAITNPDVNDDATVDVLKQGTVVSHNLNVPVGQTVHVSVPFGVNEKGTVSVIWTGSAGPVEPAQTIFSHEFTFNCVGPAATITHSCAAGGVVVDFANNGEAPTQLVVKKNGVVIDTVDLAGNATTSRTYPMAEDETATFRVTGTGFDSGDVSFTHNCVLAESTTTVPPTTTTVPPDTSVPDTVAGSDVARSATLPRTGSSSTLPLSTMAGLLLITGGLLLASVNRPMPATSTARTRSRGR